LAHGDEHQEGRGAERTCTLAVLCVKKNGSASVRQIFTGRLKRRVFRGGPTEKTSSEGGENFQ